MKIKRKHDFISMGYRVDALPAGGVTRREFFETLIRSVEDGSGVLPADWSVTWNWRNRADGIVRTDSFQKTIANSRVSFLVIAARRLRRDMQRILNEEPPPFKPRAATEADAEAEEEEREERLEERRARAKRKLAKKRHKLKRRKKK